MRRQLSVCGIVFWLAMWVNGVSSHAQLTVQQPELQAETKTRRERSIDRPVVRKLQERLRQRIESAVDNFGEREQRAEAIKPSSQALSRDKSNRHNAQKNTETSAVSKPFAITASRGMDQVGEMVSSAESPTADASSLRSGFRTSMNGDQFHPRLILGLKLSDATPLQGVVVGAIEQDGIAAMSNLEQGDRLVSVNQRAIRDLQAWEREVRKLPPSEDAELLIVRKNQLRQIQLKISKLQVATTGIGGGQEGFRKERQTVSQLDTFNQSAVTAASAFGQAVLGGLGAAYEGFFSSKQEASQSNEGRQLESDAESTRRE